MNDNELDDLIDRYLSYLDGDAPKPTLEGLPPELADLAARRFADLDLLYGCLDEALSDDDLSADPVWTEMGFGRTTVLLAGPRVARARKAAGMKLDEVLALARNAGSSLTHAELFRIENSPWTSTTQANATALVAALCVPLDKIEADSAEVDDAISQFFATADFERETARWATEHNEDVELVRADAKRLMLSSTFRATDVAHDQLLDLLRTILEKRKG